jgi:hypothetical protein
MAIRTARTLATALTATTLMAPIDARAITPDYDGERGIEARVSFGLAGLANSHPRTISMMGMAGPTANPLLGPGFAFTGSLGYRIAPVVSAGVTFSTGPLGAFPLPNDNTNQNGYSASSYAAGVYGRLYFLALVPAIPRTTRVEFVGWGDLRRLDPWASLGVEYRSVTYAQNNRAMPAIGAVFTRAAIAVPIGAGFEYRVIPALAVGLSVQAAATFGAWTSKDVTQVITGNLQTSNERYIADDPVNLAWGAGLSARYTLSF